MQLYKQVTLGLQELLSSFNHFEAAIKKYLCIVYEKYKIFVFSYKNQVV